MRLLPAILALAFLPACGGAQLILHDPIEDKCKSSGLRGCEDLADGIVLYVDGQKPLGYDKVKQGVSVNMDDPDKVKAFVMGVRLLQKVPGIGPYLAQMRPLIDMMDASADEAIKKGASRVARNQPAFKAPRVWTPDDDDDDPPAKKLKAAASATAAGPVSGDPLRAATIIVAGHKKAKACAALAQTPAGAQGDAQCVVMFVGPIVVTDVHVGLGWGVLPVNDSAGNGGGRSSSMVGESSGLRASAVCPSPSITTTTRCWSRRNTVVDKKRGEALGVYQYKRRSSHPWASACASVPAGRDSAYPASARARVAAAPESGASTSTMTTIVSLPGDRSRTRPPV